MSRPSTPRRARLLWLLLLATIIAAFPANALAEPSRVVVLRATRESPTTHEAMLRLRAELAASGFEVVSAESKPGLTARENVDDDAFGSVATFLLVDTESGAAVDVWIADHVTRKTLVRRVEVPVSTDPAAPASAALAVLAVELLRASLFEAAHTPDVPPDVVRFMNAPSATPPMAGSALPPAPIVQPAPPTQPYLPSLPYTPSPWGAPPVGAPTATSFATGDASSGDGASSPPAPVPHRRTFSIALAFSTLYHLDEEAPSLGPSVAADYTFYPQWAVELELAGPAASFSRVRAGGSVHMFEGWLTAGVSYSFLRAGRFIPRVTLDVGADHAWIIGVAEVPNHAHSAQTTSFVVTPAVGMAFGLSDHFWIDTRAGLFLAVPGVDLFVNGVNAGGISTANLLASLGLRYVH